MRIIVTGTRYATEGQFKLVAQRIQALVNNEKVQPHDTTLIHGGGTGVDSLVDLIVEKTFPQLGIERYPADWDQFGKAAGPIRNQQMVAMGADYTLAFPLMGAPAGKGGTWDTIHRSVGAGIVTYIYPLSVRKST